MKTTATNKQKEQQKQYEMEHQRLCLLFGLWYIKQNGRTSFCQRSFWHPDIRITMQNCCPCSWDIVLFSFWFCFCLCIWLCLEVASDLASPCLRATLTGFSSFLGVRWQLYVNCGPFCGFRLLLAILSFWQMLCWLCGSPFEATNNTTAATSPPLSPQSLPHLLPLRMLVALPLRMSAISWQPTLTVYSCSLQLLQLFPAFLLLLFVPADDFLIATAFSIAGIFWLFASLTHNTRSYHHWLTICLH